MRLPNSSLERTSPGVLRTLFLPLVLALLLTGLALADDYVCGDADANGSVEIIDAQFLMAYIFEGGPAPVPLRSADVNATHVVDIADATSLITYSVNGVPVPCQPEAGALGPLAGNEVIIDCPLNIDVPAETDTINVNVYWSNDQPVSGFSLGFHYDSDLITVVGRSTTGSQVPNPAFFTPALVDPVNHFILVGWADYTAANPIPVTTNGFMFSLQFEIPAGVDPHCVDIDSSFVPPAGYWVFSLPSGGQLMPNYVDCDWDLVIGGAECGTANEPPTAVCTNVTVGADANCTANASVDGGSFDTDGTIVDIQQHPAGPYPLGPTSVWLVVTDDMGDMDSCQATVTVMDMTPPTAICPSNITVGNDAGQCGANVNFSVDASDNCGVASVTATPPSGSFFETGTTPVQVVAVDNAGNEDTCFFNVTVNDIEDPVAVCPGDIVLDNEVGQCGRTAMFTIDATDNCPGVTVVADHASGSQFDVGVTTVTVTATDGAGNQDVCTFTVTVNDVEDPVAICPGNITVPNDPGETGAIVDFSIDATDNCPGVTVVSDIASGSFFPLGTTTVTVTATDNAGNQDFCTFDVTVNQTNNPPVALDTTVNTTVDVAVNAQMQAYDPDGDPITFAIDDGPFNGLVSSFDANTGSFTYTPNLSYQGADSLEFHADDGSLPSNQAFVYINVGGSGQVMMIPPEQYVYYSFRVETYYDTVYFGDFPTPYTAADVDLGSVTVEGIVPSPIQVVPSYPGFTGEVVRAVFPLKDLVNPWLPLYDTTMQEFAVDGDFNDMNSFSLLGEVTVYGKKSLNPAQYIVPPDEIVLRGDVDKSGSVNIGDVTALIRFIFADGDPPLPRMVADVNCSLSVNISDATYIIQYIFAQGPPPCSAHN